MKLRILTLPALALIGAALIGTSCIIDESSAPIPTPDGRATLMLNPILQEHGTRAGNPYDDHYGGDTFDTGEGSAEDRAIGSFRVLVYNTDGTLKVVGGKAWNFPVAAANLDDIPYKFEVDKGTFHFVFIANEQGLASTFGAEGTTGGTDFATLDQLDALLFNITSDIATDDKAIPMVTIEKNVEVCGANAIRYPDDEEDRTGTWEVSMERVAIRLSFHIHLGAERYGQWKRFHTGDAYPAVYVDGVRRQCYFTAGQSNFDITAGTYAIPVGTGQRGALTENADGSADIRVSRLIYPELELGKLTDTDNIKENAIELSLFFDEGTAVTHQALPIHRPEPETNGYSMPRNTWLWVDARIDGETTFETKVLPWGDAMLDEVDITQYDFATDKSVVVIEGLKGDTGDIEVYATHTEGWEIVDGTIPAWLDLSATEGEPNVRGTVTLVSKQRWAYGETGFVSGVRQGTFKVKAGNLTKTITVVQKPAGVLAPPGVIGIGRESGQLTLKGSREYAGTEVDKKSVFGEGQLADETVYVVYYKWGSLVATGSPDYGAFAANRDVVYAPEGYDLGAVSDWASIKNGYEVLGRWPENTVENIAQGLGDPCKVYFGDDGWKTPAGNPWGNDVDSPFGTGTGSYPTSGKGRGAAWVPAASVDPNLPENGVVAGDGKNNKDWTMFLPAAGRRSYVDGGHVSTPTFCGFYWSGTLDNGFWGLDFDENGLHPLYNPHTGNDYGMAVRCVQPTPPPTPPTIPDIGKTIVTPVYVGAFWKADQTGERIIRIPVTSSANAGDWSVQVYEYGPDFVEGDILFSASRSLDETEGGTASGITWNNTTESPADMNIPANDAKYNVADGEKFVKGNVSANGEIYFRIGLKSKWAAADNKPRYATVVVGYAGNTKWQKIYLRQGEGPDWLMRSNDKDTGSNKTSRKAIRWSPYNLTASTMTDADNYVQLSTRGGAWAKYPSQAGAIFQYASDNKRYAYHPTLHPRDGFPRYSWKTSEDFTSDQETCPPDYRRPESGKNPKGYEMLESLQANLTKGDYHDAGHSTGNTDNSAWGYYADGFFDRHAIGAQSAKVGSGSNAAVRWGTRDVAYVGRLFYNPANNASLFFPAAGMRGEDNDTDADGDDDDGLYWPGRRGHYISESDADPNETIYLVLSNESDDHVEPVYNDDLYKRSAGMSIRCVYDPPK